jgi:hypothetical protein
MRVRAEDKKILKILATIVAIACASIAVPTVLNESNRAKQDYQQQKSCVDRQMLLLSAEDAITSSNTEMIPAGMLEEAKLKLANEKLQLEKMETGFWISLPAWAFVAVCVGSGLFAAAGGYCASWIFSWATALAMIMTTRGVYHIIRRRFPDQKSPYSAVSSLRTRGQDRRKKASKMNRDLSFRGVGA